MGISIFAILDDIAALMDDVAVAAKVATQKTAAILGDDLAVSAEKATGYISSRELPVLWAISKGSLVNKLIIVPLLLTLNVYAPFAVKILLIIGGVYLSYEGAEKIIEYVFHKKHKEEAPQTTSEEEETEQMQEKKKVGAAIKTDFILSIEIVIIALSAVLDKSLAIQIITVSIIAILATIGVYGFVAILVRMDDFGFKLIQLSENKGLASKIGKGLVNALPIIVKFFSVVGTIALILVSGGIFIHSIDLFHDVLPKFPIVIREIIFGLGIGLLMVAFINFIQWIVKIRIRYWH